MVRTLPQPLRAAAGRRGVFALLEQFTSDAEVVSVAEAAGRDETPPRDVDGPKVLRQLWDLWDTIDPRYAILQLSHANDLPAMDDCGTTDAYAIAYLIAPPADAADEDDEEEDDEAAAVEPVTPNTRTAMQLLARAPGPLIATASEATDGAMTPDELRAISKLQSRFRAKHAAQLVSPGGASGASPASRWRSVRRSVDSASTLKRWRSRAYSLAGVMRAIQRHKIVEAARRLWNAAAERCAMGRSMNVMKVRAATIPQLASFAHRPSRALTSPNEPLPPPCPPPACRRPCLSPLPCLSRCRSQCVAVPRRQAALSGGPIAPAGQYGGSYSRIIRKTLQPVWNQRIELRLGGGQMNDRGEYDNRQAPYTRLRLELWDSDLMSRDDFIGEVSVPLCPMMDGRTHTYADVPLEDPQGKCQAEHGVQGTITFSLAFES